MKSLLSISILGLALALTGCGGGDSDSSGSHTSSFSTELVNGNIYSCPSEQANKVCTSDDMCVEAKCTLTKEVTKPTPKNVICEVDGNTVYGKIGGCYASVPQLNGGEPSLVICYSSGALSLSNGINSGGAVKLGDYTFTCKK